MVSYMSLEGNTQTKYYLMEFVEVWDGWESRVKIRSLPTFTMVPFNNNG